MKVKWYNERIKQKLPMLNRIPGGSERITGQFSKSLTIPVVGIYQKKLLNQNSKGPSKLKTQGRD
jgi:hypothetical protein